MQEMNDLKRTSLFDVHVSAGARMVGFGGYAMPVQYEGIVSEHLATRKSSGIFDVSHMGRFFVSGADLLGFLQHVLTNDASRLTVGQSQYTMIPTPTGGAVDDAYLYKFVDDEFLLVVNASNRDKDWRYLMDFAGNFEVELHDKSDQTAMIALQGPDSQHVLENLITAGQLPEFKRNACGKIQLCGIDCLIARTGYTGEKICFEIFLWAENAALLWKKLAEADAKPIGLGARDTLRLEAGLPLYGHELGTDINGDEIPIFACPLANFAVSFDESKGDFIGKDQLQKQFENGLPRSINPIEIIGRGLAREKTDIFYDGQKVGYVTSGNMIPVWKGDKHILKPMCLGYVDSKLQKGAQVELMVRNKPVNAVISK